MKRLSFLFCIIINVLQASDLIELSLALLEECMDENVYIPRVFNRKLDTFLANIATDDLIPYMLQAEEIGNSYLINGMAAVIVDRIDDEAINTEEMLVSLKNILKPSTYAFINKYIMIKKHKKMTRACSPGTELSIADYVSLYDVPLEYLGNIGILRFDNKNINSLYGMQDISLSDVGLIILANNCIVGDTLDPQFPADPFPGLTNAYNLLINKNMIESLPQTFFQSTPLMREVNLAQNQLKSIPAALTSNIEQLALLKLSYNMLSSIPPSDVMNTPILEVLYIDNNSLTDLPENFFMQNPLMNYLYINNNRLTSWPASAIDSLIELIYLDLSYNSLVDFTPDVLLPGCQVILQGNALTISQQDVIQSTYPDVYFTF